MICLTTTTTTTTRVHVSRSYGEAQNQRFVHGIERVSKRERETRIKAKRWRKERGEKKAVIITRFLQFCTRWATYPRRTIIPHGRHCQRETKLNLHGFVCIFRSFFTPNHSLATLSEFISGHAHKNTQLRIVDMCRDEWIK